MAKSPDTWSRRVLIKIIPHDARSIYKLQITHGHLALFAACIVLLFAAFIIEHVTQVRAEEATVKELQRVNASQQQQLVNFSNQTNHMWRRLNEIQAEHQEIKRLTTPGAATAPASSNAAPPAGTAASPAPNQADASKPVPVAVAPVRIDPLPLHGPWWAQAAARLGIGQGGVTFAGEAESLMLLDVGLDRVSLDTRKLQHEAFHVAQAREEAALAYQRMLDAIPSIWPTDGSISSGFGYRSYPDIGFHSGVDIVNYYGAPVYATAAGVVISAGWDGGFGLKVAIDHANGYVTWYAHNSELLVNVGQSVRKGQQIARLGETGFATGPHVHYEVHRDGLPINPVPFLSGSVGPTVPQVANAR